jgi:tRNA(Ile)-lysidine synthase
LNRLPISFSHILQIISRLTEAGRIWIAYSGGVDSGVLLHLLSQNRDKLVPALTAVYVNHQLSPKAEEWGEHCKKTCAQEKIEFTAVTVDAKKSGGLSREAYARELRYAALQNMMVPGDILLTAHHQDDQAETLIQQLMRGTGPDGLAGMPLMREFGPGWLVRPLLDFSRKQIREYAEQHELQWIEDESNLDIGIDRNFIRSRVIPCLQERWPSAVDVISRSAGHQAEAVHLLREIAEQDFATSAAGQPDVLDIDRLKTLSCARLRNLIRFWLKKNGHQPASALVTDIIIRELINAKHDSMPVVKWQDTEIRRYRNRIYVMAPLPDVPAVHHAWNLEQPLDTETGRLSARQVVGRGIKSDLIIDKIIHVRYRKGGETIKPAGRKETHRLKKLFQETGVPPWRRDRIPLLYIDNKLAAVTGYWIDENASARETEPGWEISLTDIRGKV